MTDELDLTPLEKASLLSGGSTFETRGAERAGIRPLFLADGPHGIRKQLGASDHLGIAASQPATCFPTASALACSWDVELAREVGEALGVEAADQGVDVLLGPGLNIKRSPLCGRNFEYFSEDPLLSGEMAAAFVLGVQSQGVAACPKHFAANSQELRRMTSDSVVDERTLREIYLAGFERVVRAAAPWAIMSSYNRINGTYAHENPFLLQRVLREEWGFDGVVVSDWGGGNDPVAAVRAGGTLEMPSPGLGSAREITAALASGDLGTADVDARVGEMRTLSRRVDPSRARAFDADAHHALARRVAAQSTVLLKNMVLLEDGGDHAVLPLAARTRVLVVGDFADTPRYQGAGSSQVNATRVVSAREALADSELEVVGYCQGFTRSVAVGSPAAREADRRLAREAIDAASGADAVLLYLGLPEIAESEGADRRHLRLPQNQVELLRLLAAAHGRVVVVLSAGSVVEMPWLDDCAAVLHGHLGGQAGAEGVVDVLTGAISPGGRLAETYPIRLEDTPAADRYPSDADTAEYREGPFVGYRYYTSAGKPVRFPFGFGLSYTSFSYSDLVVTPDGAELTVTNTGAATGSEVAQLYVGRETTDGVLRPVRELKGFAKVLLEAGESARLSLPFDQTTFGHYSQRTGSWEVETATYRVMIGANVADIRLETSLDVEGTTPAVPEDQDLAAYRSARVRDVPDAEFAALLGRSIPPPRRTAGPLGVNDPLSAMQRARSPLARLAHRLLARLIARAEAKGSPDLNLLFLSGMPFRAIAKMTNGAVSAEMVEAIVLLVNGRHVSGLGRLMTAAVRNRRTTRRLRRELRRVPAAPAPDGHRRQAGASR